MGEHSFVPPLAKVEKKCLHLPSPTLRSWIIPTSRPANRVRAGIARLTRELAKSQAVVKTLGKLQGSCNHLREHGHAAGSCDVVVGV